MYRSCWNVKEVITTVRITKNGIPNISAEAVRKFLKRRGFNIDVDLSAARLGRFARGLDKLPQNGDDAHHVLIACCAKDGRHWVCRPAGSVPENTKYLLECSPREKLVRLWKP